MSSATVSTNLVPPSYSDHTHANPPPLPMTTAAAPPARSPSFSPRPLAPALSSLAPPPTTTTGAAAASSSAAAAAASTTIPAAPVTTTRSSKASKQVVYLGAARCKRKAADYQWPCKKQKTALAHIIYAVGDHAAPPPPARVTLRPLVVTLDEAAAATKAAKALKGLDAGAGEASTSGNTGSGSGGNRALQQLAGAAATVAASSSLGPASFSSSSSSSLPGPPTGAGSMAASSGGASSSPAAPLLGPTRKSTSAAAAAVAAEQSRREEAAARAASVVTPAMEATLGRAEAALGGQGYPGMAELLRFLLHAKVRLLDHAALLAAVAGAVGGAPALRKAYCDFEAVWACGDSAQLVYGKRPAAVFAELVGKEKDATAAAAAAAVETYDERIFLRLFVVFAVTRLQLARQMAAGDAEVVALVDGLLKPWVARAYDYI